MAIFPDVPFAIGVPPIPRDPLAVFPTVALLTADRVTAFSNTGWGVYLGGAPVISADTVAGLDFKRDWAIADYPIEGGGFQSYDKVNTPFITKLQFAAGGSLANRQALLDTVDAISDTLLLYDVVTPERVYLSVSVAHTSYRRAAGNIGMIVIDMALMEVRITAGIQQQIAKSPSGQPQTNGGNVQPSAEWTPTTSSVQYLQKYPYLGVPPPLPGATDFLPVQ